MSFFGDGKGKRGSCLTIYKMMFDILIFLLLSLHIDAQRSYYESRRNFIRDSFIQLATEPPDTRFVRSEYDFIVVGAGSAGCAITARLTEVETEEVLLIEAGGPEEFRYDIPMEAPLLQTTDIDWKYYTKPDGKACLGLPSQRCYFPRGKVMGGSSVLNFMIYSRGHYKDYDRWEEIFGCKGWSYSDVLPYFKKMEKFLIDELFDSGSNGDNGPLHIEYSPYESSVASLIVDAFLEQGYNYSNINDRDNNGFSRIPGTLKSGTRHSSSRAYLHPISKRPNLHVKKRSQVTRILINPITKIAYGVEYLHDGVLRTVRARKEVIISGGAINSPQLLMLSGIGNAMHLISKGVPVIQHLPGVGKNLQDHIAMGGLIFLVNGIDTTTPMDLITNHSIIEEYYNHHTGPLSVPGGCEVIALTDPDNEGIPRIELLLVSQSIAFNFFFDTPIAEYLEPSLAEAGWVCLPMVMKPYSAGEILLRNKNPLEHPVIKPNYFCDTRDLDTMVNGGRLMIDLLKTEVMQKYKARTMRIPNVECNKYKLESDEYLACLSRQYTFNIYHQSCTCRMGANTDPNAVVDERLRVIGVKNLRVIDVSVMPEVPSGHTNGPTIMIAEKGADMIKEDWGFPKPSSPNYAYKNEL